MRESRSRVDILDPPLLSLTPFDKLRRRGGDGKAWVMV
jgi:hypothetical protein